MAHDDIESDSEAFKKEEGRRAVRALVIPHLAKMTFSQIVSAVGCVHLYTRDSKGKFDRVVDAARAEELLKHGEEGKHFFFFTKDPSTQAYTELLNRALDRPADQKIEVEVTHSVGIRQRLVAGRERARLMGQSSEPKVVGRGKVE